MRKEISKETFKTLSMLTLVIAFLLAYFTIRSLFLVAYPPSGSMIPTLQPGDIAFASKVNPAGNLQREDIVLFDPHTEMNEGIVADDSGLYVKRVIGLPGDTVEVSNGVLYVNGEAQIRDYTAEETIYGDFGPVTVPDNHFFMMGDNRNSSQDCRIIGPIPAENITGKVFWHQHNPILPLIKGNSSLL